MDPVETLPFTHKPRPGRDANGNNKSLGLVPGSADPASASASAQSCGPCSSAKRCRSVFCTVLTCGLYRICQGSGLAPCLAPSDGSPERAEKVSLRNTRTKGEEEDEMERGEKEWLNDVHIGGVKVEEPVVYPEEPRSLSRLSSTGAVTHFSRSSLHQSVALDDWDEDEENVENVDSLIAKKLLELYSEYQIEELARCTSDSVFLRKTKGIHQLINSLAEEHQMDEQEAECRLVRGIIRISTRKSKKKPYSPTRERTLSDSGHETMKDSSSTSFSNNNDYKSSPNIQISELTALDEHARQMWRNNGGQSSVSPTSSSPSTADTSSGVPLIRTSVRT